ncbi:MAG TPA: histidine kinase [Cyclobacteriaceae bacterium]|nr:histidine kinase [Cyclobacteriaceae bacterium]
MRQKFKLTKGQRYWLCQVSGWYSIVLVETINYTYILVGSFSWDYITSFGKQATLGLIVSHFYKVFFIKKSAFEKPLKNIWVKGLMDTFNISLIISIILLLPDIIKEWASVADHKQEVAIEIFGRIFNQARYIVVWIFIYYMYQILQRNRAITQEKLQMENLLTTTELELLKTQLNPHFLFNALNSIKALIRIDASKARHAIVQLSELLQSSLNYEKSLLISMKDEMYKVEKYLELEKIRFGNRLSYTLDVSEAAMVMQVPPALILTLAENAIKHGVTQLPDGGEIQVNSRIAEENMIIEVINSGDLKSENISGIGLKNARSRLKNLFGDNASLILQKQSEETVITKVCYPIVAYV